MFSILILFSTFLTKEALKATSSRKNYLKFTVNKYHLTSSGRHSLLLSAFSLAKPQHNRDQTDPYLQGFSSELLTICYEWMARLGLGELAWKDSESWSSSRPKFYIINFTAIVQVMSLFSKDLTQNSTITCHSGF